MELFDNPIINEVENQIATELGLDVYRQDREIIAGIINEEIEQSMIDKSILLSYFIEKKEELVKFGVLLYKNEQGVNDGEEYPTGGVVPKSERPVTIESLGPAIGFGITYSIYYFFLSNNSINELGEYLIKRRIPKYKKFQTRLIKYYNEALKK